jgi:hypothetical protein
MKIFTKMESRFFPHTKWRFASLVLIFFILFLGCSGFEEILPTQPAPIGLVRDHSNDCIYVIFLHEINMVCSHTTPKGPLENRSAFACSIHDLIFAFILLFLVTNVISERELQGNPLSGWLDRVDADGYFVFCVGYFPDNYASCVMHATRLARDNSQNNTTRYISAPDLLSRFSNGRINTKNSYEKIHLIFPELFRLLLIFFFIFFGSPDSGPFFSPSDVEIQFQVSSKRYR